MKTSDPKVVALRAKVDAAQQELDMAIAFHEVWKPAAYDTDLHARMGVSYATQTFNITRTALRREMVLALARLWDRRPEAVGMQAIAANVGNKSVMDVLVAERSANMGIPGAADQVREEMDKKAKAVLALVVKYDRGGSHAAGLKKLITLRNERLAHRQTVPVAVTGDNVDDAEIEAFYQDNLRLINILLSLVKGQAYDPEDTAGIFRHYAGHFWAAARGEQTEGHPNYRGRPGQLPAG